VRQWVFGCALLALVACSKKEPPPSAESGPQIPASSQPVAPVATAPTPAPSAAAAAADLPVEEDFEDEANSKVNAQTLDAQLDALEKEIKAN